MTAALMKRITDIERITNHNTQLFINSISMLEIQGQAFRQFMDDLYAEARPLVVGLDKPDDMHVKVKEDGTIDWQTYMQTFLQKVRDSQNKPAEPPPPPPVVASLSEEDPVIFGGGA